MKLAVAALIRNEIDIVGAFLQHLDALFDYALLMDHGSIDGTDQMLAQACARRSGWTMWHVEPVGYHQVAFSTFALQHLMRHTDADMVLLLDADEFIDVPDRTSLELAFGTLTDADRIGCLRWRNCVSERLDTRVISSQEAIWRSAVTATLGKVVIPRRTYTRHGHEFHLAIGNHALYYDPDRFVPAGDVGEILHLPIRSHSQLKSKVLAGVFSVMAQVTREPAQSWHWYDILWRIADGTLRDEDLIGIAAHYSEPSVQSSHPTSWAVLQADGFSRRSLDVAFGHPLPTPAEALVLDPVRLVATILRRFQPEDPQGCALVLEDNTLRFVPRAGAARH